MDKEKKTHLAVIQNSLQVLVALPLMLINNSNTPAEAVQI